jgi:ubiquitin thioesterase CYLD
MVYKQKLTIERSKGPKGVDQLLTVELKLSPLDQPILGKNKGIEGNSNSGYMDATIFCMFAYNNVFDTLLYMDAITEPLQKLQQVLRDHIVHVLRDKQRGFVGRKITSKFVSFSKNVVSLNR